MPARFETVKIVTVAKFEIGEGEGEVGFFSAKRWDGRNRAGLIEFATPCHDAQVAGSYRVSNPLRLAILAAKSEDYTIAPQHLHTSVHTMPGQFENDRKLGGKKGRCKTLMPKKGASLP